MTWRQDIEDPPLRERHDIYLDGLLTGAALSWLGMMLYDHVRRDHPSHVGTFLWAAVVVIMVVVTAFKVWKMKKRG